MTFRIVPASAYELCGVGDLNFEGDPFGLVDRASGLLRFIRHTPFDVYLAKLEGQLSAPFMPPGFEAPAELPNPSVLDAALTVSEHFDRMRWAIHGLTIAYVIEHLLPADETVLTCALRRPRENRPFDLETDQRVARLRLPVPVGSKIDERGLVDDLLALAMDESGRRTELYVVGEWPGLFLSECHMPLRYVLGKNAPPPETPAEHFGEPDLSVAEFRKRQGARVDVLDVGPFLTHLFAHQGAAARRVKRDD